MIDGLPAIVGLASPVGATLVVFWLVFTGKLVVKAQHEEQLRTLREARDDAWAQRDGWKETAHRKGETVSILTQTNAKLIETANVTQHVMHALQETAGGTSHGLQS